MPKNLLLCGLGLVLGFIVGFLVTNSITKPVAQVAGARPPAAGGEARPLGPGQMGGELPPGHPEVPGGGGAATAAATSAEAQGAMDKADRAPKDFQAQVEAANVFYGLQDYDKAALYLDRALKLKGGDYDALVMMGNTKYDAGDFAAAATFYERALAVKAGSPDVRTDLGNTYFRRGDFDRAVAEYRKSVAIDPDHLNSWRNIAAASVEKGDKASVAEAVEQLTRLAPQSPQTEAFRRKLAEMP